MSVTNNILIVDELFPLRQKFAKEFLESHLVEVISDQDFIFTDFKGCSNVSILALSPSFFNWTLDTAFLDLFPNLRAICLSGGWHEHLNKSYCRSRNLTITNVPGFSSTASAEWCIGMTLVLMRNLNLHLRKNNNVDGNFPGTELSGKTAGIVGMGGVGHALIKPLQGLGVHCKYWSPISRVEGAQYASLDEVVSTADVLYLTFYESSATANLISQSHLQSMRKGALIVSGLGSQPELICDCVNWQRAIDMVKNGRLGGLAIECGEEEHIDVECDRVLIVQGHSGWCTWESIQRGTDIWISNIEGVINGDPPNPILMHPSEGH